MRRRRERGARVLVRGTGLRWGFVVAVPLAAALIAFIAQNTQKVTVHWLAWKVDTSLAVTVLVTILAAVLLAEIVGVVWRHRRRRLLAHHAALQEELARRAQELERVAQPAPDERVEPVEPEASDSPPPE